MSTALAARLRPHLARLVTPPDTDADLLRRFVAARDEEAFAELVRRHGPAVLAVCRRITGDPHDADDAFQAAFLVLARKAHRVRPGEPLAAWLYGIAVRAARAALARRCRRRNREVAVAELPDVPGRTAEPFDPDDARAVLAEVARLTPAVRAAVVLCELEGRSRASAARELGIPEGTLSSRLAAARKVLAARLRDRGLAAAVLAAVAASARGARPVWSSEVSSRVTELTEAVMRTGIGITWKVAAAAVVAAAGLAAYARPAVPETAPEPRPADPTRLIVGFTDHVRYLTPDGREAGRVTGDAVRAAGVDIDTRVQEFSWNTARPAEKAVTEFLPVGGRAAPDGRVPLNAGKKLYLLAAGPAAVAAEPAAGGRAIPLTGNEVPYFAAWSADGAKAVVTRTEERLFAPDRQINTLVDLAAGTAEPLKLPAGHRVLDWAPDGTWFLTLRYDQSFSFGNGWSTRVSLCRVSADGAKVEVLADPLQFVWHAAISPDGTKVAYARVTTSPVEGVSSRKGPVEVCNGFAVVILDLATTTRTTVLAAGGGTVPNQGEATAGVRWSPDGTRLAVASLVLVPGSGPKDWAWANRVRVCDADGGNARVVLETGKQKPHLDPSPTVFDWR
ncbi:MAG: sigma-70 family RNA polymerase sigma factor [Gemmataceae bacterium]|nr:sigma-70 family RNA polymerase sigma factor [Gemmataceae bacterium]